MTNLILFFSVFLWLGNFTCAQTDIDTAAIKSQLDLIRERDQKTRKGIDSVNFIHFIDSSNLAQIEILIAKYGWLGQHFIGQKGNQTCFLIIQHADSATQIKYLPLLSESVKNGESSASDLALLTDRILMRQGKPQIYGTQVVFDSMGNPLFYPIEDERNVNKRRLEVGLETIEEYALHFGITYRYSEH